MFGLFLAFLPAMLLVWYVTGSDSAVFVLFLFWAPVYVISGVFVLYSRCPRCGQRFHEGPFPWAIPDRRYLGMIKPSVVRRLRVITPFTRRCLNCGFSLKRNRN